MKAKKTRITIAWDVTVSLDGKVETNKDGEIVNRALKKRIFDEALAKLQKRKKSDGRISDVVGNVSLAPGISLEGFEG